MRRTDPVKLADIIQLYMEMGGDRAEFDRRKVEYLWSEVVGPRFNQATERRHVSGDTLHVYMSSGVLKSELSFNLPMLVKAINEAMGKNVITKIILH